MKKTRVFTAIYKKVTGGYSAWIEEMPNIISEGKTRKEAERNIKDALSLMLETNFIMSMKDATGKVERSNIKVAA